MNIQVIYLHAIIPVLNVHAVLSRMGVCCLYPRLGRKGVIEMTDIEQHREHIEYTFNGFCKTVLYHAALDAYYKLKRKQQHEVSFEYLKKIDFGPSCTDEYFAVQEVPTVFIVQGKKVIVENEVLANALLHLSEKRREVLLLRFYLGYNDAEIGRMFGRCRSTINRRKHIALRLLRKEMETLQNKE